ncbi:MAG: hypothetical protein HGA53_04935 [Anaerolineaceae bacterium]|nr:hypothetical protein [Anaerolineaceae bacterium]
MRRRQRRGRGPWYLLTGLILGLGLGLIISWVIFPVKFTETAPEILASKYKETYRIRIAESFLSNSDIGRTRQRLALLNDTDPIQLLIAQSQRLLADGGSLQDAEALAKLAAALQNLPVDNTPVPENTVQAPDTTGTAVGIQTATAQVEPTQTPAQTFTPRPTLIQQPVGVPFVLKEKIELCDKGTKPGVLQIDVQNKIGNPMPGVRIDIAWIDGAESFYTGFYPEISSGYADYIMEEGRTYRVKVGDGSDIVDNVQPPLCKGEQDTMFLGGWRLIFTEP